MTNRGEERSLQDTIPDIISLFKKNKYRTCLISCVKSLQREPSQDLIIRVHLLKFGWVTRSSSVLPQGFLSNAALTMRRHHPADDSNATQNPAWVIRDLPFFSLHQCCVLIRASEWSRSGAIWCENTYLFVHPDNKGSSCQKDLQIELFWKKNPTLSWGAPC